MELKTFTLIGISSVFYIFLCASIYCANNCGQLFTILIQKVCGGDVSTHASTPYFRFPFPPCLSPSCSVQSTNLRQWNDVTDSDWLKVGTTWPVREAWAYWFPTQSVRVYDQILSHVLRYIAYSMSCLLAGPYFRRGMRVCRKAFTIQLMVVGSFSCTHIFEKTFRTSSFHIKKITLTK